MSIRDYLEENGPSTSDELPYTPSISDKQMGVTSFDIGSNPSPGKGGQGGNTKVIYYLWEDHDKEKIVRQWIEHNQSIVETLSRQGLRTRLRKNGKSWHDPVDKAFPQFDNE